MKEVSQASIEDTWVNPDFTKKQIPTNCHWGTIFGIDLPVSVIQPDNTLWRAQIRFGQRCIGCVKGVVGAQLPCNAKMVYLIYKYYYQYNVVCTDMKGVFHTLWDEAHKDLGDLTGRTAGEI